MSPEPVVARLLGWLVGLAAWLAVALPTSPAQALPPLVETDDVTFQIGGYLRAFAAAAVAEASDASDAALLGALRDARLVPPATFDLQTNILRLEASLSLFDVVSVEAHSRLSSLYVSAPGLASSGGLSAGVGSTLAPPRTVDLHSVLHADDRWRIDHDLDRLSLRVFLGPVDVAVGRQAITWGHATLFPVADIWTPFDPFDLDTSQKRGVDGVRVTWAPEALGGTLDLEWLLVDRGTLEGLSGGMQATLFLGVGDLYLAAAKSWGELLGLVGFRAEIDAFTLRAEVVAGYDVDLDGAVLPRVTVGADYFHPDVFASLELHFNGLGSAGGGRRGSAGYLEVAASPQVARGQTRYLGQWYAGAVVGVTLHELVRLTLTGVLAAQDPSALVSAALALDVAQDLTVQVGAFMGLGGLPIYAPPTGAGAAPVALHSEMGVIPHQAFVDVAYFF